MSGMSTEIKTAWAPTHEEYHADHSHVSHSMMKQFRKSRRDYFAIYEAETKSPPPPSEEMNLGTALHTAILEPAELEKRVAFAPPCDKRTKDGKQQWADFKRESESKLILTWDCRERLDLMLRAINANEEAVRLLGRIAERELSVRWQDDATGLQCKARLDALCYLPRPVVIDIKTCRSPVPAAFSAAMYSLGYHTQGAHYLDGFHETTGRTAEFGFIAVANCDPFSCAVYKLGPLALATGRAKNAETLRLLAGCYESDDWREPHEKQITELELPRHARYGDEWQIEG